MRLHLEVDMDNAAFENDDEIIGILTIARQQVSNHLPLELGDAASLYDSNGNRVGAWQVIEP